jgi:hypothetical protein
MTLSHLVHSWTDSMDTTTGKVVNVGITALAFGLTYAGFNASKLDDRWTRAKESLSQRFSDGDLGLDASRLLHITGGAIGLVGGLSKAHPLKSIALATTAMVVPDVYHYAFGAGFDEGYNAPELGIDVAIDTGIGTGSYVGGRLLRRYGDRSVSP